MRQVAFFARPILSSPSVETAKLDGGEKIVGSRNSDPAFPESLARLRY
jgi:hypothetical protein